MGPEKRASGAFLGLMGDSSLNEDILPALVVTDLVTVGLGFLLNRGHPRVSQMRLES